MRWNPNDASANLCGRGHGISLLVSPQKRSDCPDRTCQLGLIAWTTFRLVHVTENWVQGLNVIKKLINVRDRWAGGTKTRSRKLRREGCCRYRVHLWRRSLPRVHDVVLYPPRTLRALHVENATLHCSRGPSHARARVPCVSCPSGRTSLGAPERQV